MNPCILIAAGAGYLIIGMVVSELSSFSGDTDWCVVLFWPVLPLVLAWFTLSDWIAGVRNRFR